MPHLKWVCMSSRTGTKESGVSRYPALTRKFICFHGLVSPVTAQTLPCDSSVCLTYDTFLLRSGVVGSVLIHIVY